MGQQRRDSLLRHPGAADRYGCNVRRRVGKAREPRIHDRCRKDRFFKGLKCEVVTGKESTAGDKNSGISFVLRNLSDL